MSVARERNASSFGMKLKMLTYQMMCDQCEASDHQLLYRIFWWKLISKRISDKRASMTLFEMFTKL